MTVAVPSAVPRWMVTCSRMIAPSPISTVETWRSPVLFIHGDDDRNVRFSQTVDLVRRIAARGVEYEELVIVDDTHHFMRHANQLRVNAAIAAYLEKKLKLPKM